MVVVRGTTPIFVVIVVLSATNCSFDRDIGCAVVDTERTDYSEGSTYLARR